MKKNYKLILFFVLGLMFFVPISTVVAFDRDACYAYCDNQTDLTPEELQDCYDYCDTQVPPGAVMPDGPVTGTITGTGGEECQTGKFCPNVPFGDFQGNLEAGPELLGLYIKTWFNFIVGGVGILATVMIMYAGLKWLTSRGNTAVITDSKEKIWSAIIGMVLAFLSFTIFMVINPDLVSTYLPTLDSVDYNIIYSGDDIPPGGVAVNTPDARAENNVRQFLGDNNVQINALAPRTQVGGLLPETIEQIIFIRNGYTGNDFWITGGSERAGHSGLGHPSGRAYDVRNTTGVSNYINNDLLGGREPDGETGDGFPFWNTNINGQATRIINEEDHTHFERIVSQFGI